VLLGGRKNPTVPLTIQNCQNCFNPPCVLTSCFAINGPSIQIVDESGNGIFSNGGMPDRINCSFSTVPSESTGSELIAFEIENGDVSGANSYASLWILPNNGTWIFLTKQVIQGVDYWLRGMMYHTAAMNVPQPPNAANLNTSTLFYNPYIMLDTNTVTKMQTHNYFNGWLAMAAIGGWAFMLVIFHSIVMGIISIFLENDSRFLLHGGRNSEFMPINK